MLGERLKQLREERGLSLDKVVKDIGITIATLSRYENGVHSPRITHLLELVNYYNTTIDYLLGINNTKYNNLGLGVREQDFLYRHKEYLEASIYAFKNGIKAETIKLLTDAYNKNLEDGR